MNHLLAFSRSGGGWTDRSSGPLDVGLGNVYAAVFGYENDPRFQGEVVRAKCRNGILIRMRFSSDI